jgi:adenosylmethionine-8-amino-7-oxononanoate aminotransferase
VATSSTARGAARLPRVQRTSVAESAYVAIRASVISGRFKAGERLVEARLAEELGVSRGPVREALRRLCEEGLLVDILLIADEVITGFGRTGRNFGVDHWGVTPDVIVTAKGLAGGYAPLGAVIMTDAVADTFIDAGTSFTHDLTYGGHPVTCAAGLAVLRIIKRDGLVANAAEQGAYLSQCLRELAARHDVIGDVRGKGLLVAVELVADRATGRPFAAELELTRRLHLAAQDRGLMIYPGAGGDGVVGDQVIISPPLIVQREDVDEIVARFEQALEDVLQIVDR